VTEEQELEGKKEENTTETEVEMSAEKAEASEKKTEYKRSDYEYKSWSGGVPAPDGWEKCPGYADVIRRLKPVTSKPEDKPVETKTEAESSHKEAKKDGWEPWGPSRGGSCYRR
jgi:hypothetical protein